MRGPSLQKTAILSFTLHATAFLIISLVLRQSTQIVMPSPYTVSLVSPDSRSGSEKRRPEEPSVHKEEPSVHKTEAAAAPPSDITGKTGKETAREKDIVAKKISAIEAKKRIERMVRLRSAVISLKGGSTKQRVGMKTASSSGGKGTPFDDYYSTITKEIRQQWAFPEIGRKDMEAIVSVRILRDGTALVQKIEKSSGNALFDRSAVKALARASPLSPPPYEMEIGVRFFP